MAYRGRVVYAILVLVLCATRRSDRGRGYVLTSLSFRREHLHARPGRQQNSPQSGQFHSSQHRIRLITWSHP